MALSADQIRSIIEAFVQGTAEQQEVLEQLQGVTDRRLQSLQDEFDAIQRIVDARNAERASLEAQIDIAQRAAAAAATETTRRQANASAVEAQIEQLNHLAQAEAASTEEIQAQTDALMAQNVATANSADGFGSLTSAVEKTSDSLGNQGKETKKLIGLSDDLLGGLVGQINSFAILANAADEASESTDRFAAAKAITNKLVANSVELMLKLAEDIYAAEAAFRKATGATREFSSDIGRSFEQVRRFGVTLEDAGKATSSLYRNFTDFKFATRDARGTLVNTAGILSRLGVSTDDFSKGLQTQVKAFGMTERAGATAFLELTHFAREAGIPVDQLSAQYAAMSPKLAKLGDAGHKTFMGLARVAHTTGLEMHKILAIVNKFDTFEGAADQAGKLNAALGGNFVNAMELMMDEDPVSRFNQIRDAITDQGLTFENMSYYQRKFFTESIDGLETEADLALLLSGNMDLLASSTEMTTEKAEELAQAARDTQSLQEALKSLVVSVTPILTPMIEGLTKFIQELTASEETIESLKTGLKSVVFLKFLSWAIKAVKYVKPLLKIVSLLGIKFRIAAAAAMGLYAGYKFLTKPGRLFGGSAKQTSTSAATSNRAFGVARDSITRTAGGSTNVNNQFNPANNITVKVGGADVAAVVEEEQAKKTAIDAFTSYSPTRNN